MSQTVSSRQKYLPFSRRVLEYLEYEKDVQIDIWSYLSLVDTYN